MSKTLTVRESINYIKFNFLSGINRPTLAAHINKMRRSILNMGCVRPIVVAELDFIDGVLRRYIIDGQHLFEALRGLELSIPYSLVEVRDKEELIQKIALLNASSKSWVLLDYVRAWKCLINDYNIIYNTYMTYHLPITSIAAIAMNKTERSSLSANVKSGEIKIINDKYDVLCKYAVEILDAINTKNTGFIKERVVIALLRYYNNISKYDHNNTVKKASLFREEILAAADNEDALYTILEEKVFV